MADLVCVKWAERKDGRVDHTGWCATKRKTTHYSDHVKTLCSLIVSFPWGLKRRQPTCSECLKKLARQRRS